MKYYKIILAGKGAELYPFQLNTKQYETFRDNGVEQDEMEKLFMKQNFWI